LELLSGIACLKKWRSRPKATASWNKKTFNASAYNFLPSWRRRRRRRRFEFNSKEIEAQKKNKDKGTNCELLRCCEDGIHAGCCCCCCYQ